MVQNLSQDRKRRIGILSTVQGIFCLFLILFGTFLCLERYLATGISFWSLAFIAGISAGIAEIMRYGKVQKFTALLLFLFFFGMLLLKNQTLLMEGGKEIANQVILLINKHYHTEYLYWFVREQGEGKAEVFLMLCALIGFWESFLVSLFPKKRSRNRAFLSMPFLVFTAGILVGRTPSLEGMFLILTGYLVLQLDLEVRGTWILGTGMGTILVLAFLLTQSNTAQKILKTYHEPWLQRQLNFEEGMLELVEQFSKIRLFSQNKVQKEYLLTNEEPNQTGEEVFQITVEQRPKQNIYIRGFIGGDYGEGNWKSVSGQEFSDWAGEMGLSNQKCQQVVQNYSYWNEEGGEKGKIAKKVKMELKAPVSGYTLVPYYTKIPEKQSAWGDGALVPKGENTFHWESFLFKENVSRYEALTLEEWTQQEKDRDVPEQEIWESYDSYVQKVYTRLPEQGLKNLRKFVKESLGGKISEYQQVLEFLWGNAEYSQDLAPLPEGEDYAEYFLLKQKKGFCVHFATAGTLVFRMYKVPARYVSGYVIFPEDFKQNSDGTFTAVVKDERGHAWTEIFQKETGFLPLEVTPPAYFAALQDLQPGEDVKDALQRQQEQNPQMDHEKEQESKAEQENMSQVEKPELPEDHEKEEQLQAPKSQAETENDKKSVKAEKEEARIMQKTGIGIGVCLAGICSVSLLLCYRKRRMEDRRKAEFFQKNHDKGALAVGKSMRLLLTSLGLEQKKDMSDSEYGALLEQRLPGMEWERIIFLLQKAAFSKHGITEEEFQVVIEAYRELKAYNSKKKENTP